MSKVHGIFKSRFSSTMRVEGLPWLGSQPLGGWMKEDRVVPFSVLQNMVTGGGLHTGKATAEREKINGKENITPLKVSNDIDLKTGSKRSYWKFVPTVKLPDETATNVFTSLEEAGANTHLSFFKERGFKELKAKFKTLGVKINSLTSNLDAYQHAYFYFMNELGGDKINPLQEESFVAEVASAYLLLQHGVKVPEEYLSQARLNAWSQIMRQNVSDDDQRFLTNVGQRANSLLR